MKRSYVASVFITGAVAMAIAAAPSAFAAAVPVTGTDGGGGVSTTQRQGHVHIKATPPAVSDARSYGESSTPDIVIDD
jgi:hypothetical protein